MQTKFVYVAINNILFTSIIITSSIFSRICKLFGHTKYGFTTLKLFFIQHSGIYVMEHDTSVTWENFYISLREALYCLQRLN